MTKKELFDLNLNIGFRFLNSVDLFVLVEKKNEFVWSCLATETEEGQERFFL